MANLWESLDEEDRMALVNHALEGKPRTAENINRIRDHLAQNPTYAEKLAKEAGLTDDTLSDEEDVAASNDIERNVDAALEDEGDVQEVGELPKTRTIEERLTDLESRLLPGDRARQVRKGSEIVR